ncbi:MAG: hypothetical protein ACRC0V_08435, partial [Fusobacteriaceae bacterium]
SQLDNFLNKINEILYNKLELCELKEMDILYDNLIVFYGEKNEVVKEFLNLGKILIKNSNKIEENSSKKNQLYSEILKNDKEIDELFYKKFLKNFEYYIENFINFEMDFYIGKDTRLFKQVIKKIMLKDTVRLISKDVIVNKKIFDFFINNFPNKQEKKEIYKEILNIYCIHKNIPFTKSSDFWFYNILETIGTLNKNKEEWKEFSNEQRFIFKRWFFTKEIDRLFNAEVNDPERTEFWKKYVNYIIDIKFYPDLGQAIIMELTNHTIIEFGKKGNAAYLYPREVIKIKNIDEYQKRELKGTNLIYRLKNESGAIKPNNLNSTRGWAHTGGWQGRFKFSLLKLNYE